jgi:hypothetical protein
MFSLSSLPPSNSDFAMMSFPRGTVFHPQMTVATSSVGGVAYPGHPQPQHIITPAPAPTPVPVPVQQPQQLPNTFIYQGRERQMRQF